MPNYRRARAPGGTFFFTLVTQQRAPLLVGKTNLERLRHALRVVQEDQPFDIVAAVVLPDHLHFVWSLPAGDGDFSKRIGRLKVLFGRSLASQASVWQPRFWEHLIRSEHDLRRHVDYIHYNPVKHGLVSCPHSWSASSFARWARQGRYDARWGCVCAGRQAALPELKGLEDATGE